MTLKKSDPEIEELLKALQQAEYWRTSGPRRPVPIGADAHAMDT